jgi:TetR/AcrR family transcriptional regulator, fatty acid metabolism regulator protein
MTDEKTREPQERGRERRERILDAAFTTFAERGYRESAIDDIAHASETSKGGVYFHFATKDAIFRELMRTTADRLDDKVTRAVADEPDPIAAAAIAVRTVLETFAGHRRMARLLFLDAFGAGRVFTDEVDRLHARFSERISGYLDRAVADGVVAPIDTAIAGQAWFGALDEIVARWLMAEKPGRLLDAYPTLLALLLRSVGIDDATVAMHLERQAVGR